LGNLLSPFYVAAWTRDPD